MSEVITQIPHSLLGTKLNLVYRHLPIRECSLNSTKLKTLNEALGKKFR